MQRVRTPYRYTLEIKYTLLTVVLLIVLAILEQFKLLDSLDAVLNRIGHQQGLTTLLALYLIALVGNTALIVQVPYTLPMLSAALAGASLPTMILFGLVSGMGAGTGKLLTYTFVDRVLAANQCLQQNYHFRRMSGLIHRNPRWIPAYILVMLSLPLPDEAVLVPLGMVRYGLAKIGHWLFLGKVIHNLWVAILFFSLAELSKTHIAHEMKAGVLFLVLMLMATLSLYQLEKTHRQQALT